MNKLTAVVLTKNEEENIDECLRSISFADEILIIDNNSTDATVDIAKKYKARIIKNTLKSFSSQRNLALDNAENEWVLFVDADERVGTDLREEIIKIKNNEINDGFFIRREDYFLGRQMRYGDLGNVWILRLGRKDKGRWEGDVHEQWKIKGKTTRLNSFITHLSHKNLTHFIKKLNYYSSVRANELIAKNTSVNLFSIIMFPVSKFTYLYLLKLGFLDGLAGFIHALLMRIYLELSREKIYLRRNEK